MVAFFMFLLQFSVKLCAFVVDKNEILGLTPYFFGVN